MTLDELLRALTQARDFCGGDSKVEVQTHRESGGVEAIRHTARYERTIVTLNGQQQSDRTENKSVVTIQADIYGG